MVTAGGLETSGRWRSSVYFDVDALTRYWRKGVIRLLRASLRSGTLGTNLSAEQVEATLRTQENRWWSVKLQSLGSKEHFLRYAGRYARRPPIAQRRITAISTEEIQFWANDKRQHSRGLCGSHRKNSFPPGWHTYRTNTSTQSAHTGCSLPAQFGTVQQRCSTSSGIAPGHDPDP